MPLALQALLPILVLLVAAALLQLRGRKRGNGWIAIGATTISAIIALVELLRLAPGEHVDVPYLTTFPYAELVIRLDGLSLAFAAVTLSTAALLMLVRQWDRGDRRDPWLGWLLTSAAACALILAANLVLLYILLQVLTLSWSGALDETAPRRRTLRLVLQVADIGLLLAAASAIQSVGTSSYSGVPSDTFGVASFWLMLLPVLARIAAVATGARRPLAAVAFGPAIAWLAPAAYILMRLLALMAGRLPDRPTAVILFATAALAAVVFALSAMWTRGTSERGSLLLAAQAAAALALSSGSEPLLTVASTWMWLLLIPLAGLVSVRSASQPDADVLARVQLAMVPGSVAFTGLYLGALALDQRGLLFAMIPLLAAVVLSTLVCLRDLPRPAFNWAHPTTAWAGALTIVGAFPVIVMIPLVEPAASTVRLVPSGTLTAPTPLGLSTPFGDWPALPVFVIVAILLVVGYRLTDRMQPAIGALSKRVRAIRPGFSMPRLEQHLDRLPPALGGGWSRAVLWGAFAVVVIVAMARP